MKYRLSIFKNRQSKEDHGDSVPVTETVHSIEELDTLQKTVAWSPMVYSKPWRSMENCSSSQLIVLDFDNASFNKFKELQQTHGEECLVTFTQSHRGLKNGQQQADCFRATFFLREECFDMQAYRETLTAYLAKYAEAGAEQNPNINHYFWKSTGKHSELKTHFTGKKAQLAKVKKKVIAPAVLKTDKSKIPLLTEYLLMSEASLEHRRNDIINKLSYILASHGYDVKEIKEIIYGKRLERPLDERYDRVIEEAALSGIDLFEQRKSQFGEKFFKSMSIEAFFEEFTLVFSMSCSHHGIVSLGEKSYSDDIIIDHMIVEASKYQLKNKSKDTLKALLNVWKLAEIEKNVEVMSRSIAFVEPSAEICKFVEAVTGMQHPLDIAVMKHWIWQVKRKFKRLSTKHHIMPIFYGKTLSGKTTAIEKLLEPIKQLTMIAELTIVNDSRNDFNLIEKLVIFFDELGKAEKVEVSNLKQKITSSAITYRRLGTNQNMNGFNMCSFIGASNNPVIDAIVDPTSARRFYELKTLDLCNWRLINSINYLEIWQSVNEMEEIAPIEQHLFDLSAAQEDIRAKDYVEEFIFEYGLKPIVPDVGRFVSTMELYLKLKEWLETQNKGQYIPSLSKFSRRLKMFLEKADPRASAGTTLNGFYVSEDYSGKTVITSKEINLGD
jgi:hypothetical protein